MTHAAWLSFPYSSVSSANLGTTRAPCATQPWALAQAGARVDVAGVEKYGKHGFILVLMDLLWVYAEGFSPH